VESHLTVRDQVWSAQDTSPAEIEAALRQLLVDFHRENEGYWPARVLNLVCVVDRQWSGEIANRLRGVGRYHASRTIVCSVDPQRTKLDATATIATDADPKPGEFALLRETIVVDCGPRHLEHLDSIVDPLVVTDLATVMWSPHGHWQALDSMRHLAQVVLLDSVDDPDIDEALRRACSFSDELYVVDLAWLRSTPWRERVAAAFDPPNRRHDLDTISSIQVRHHPDSTVAGLLLLGWLATRLGWEPTRLMTRGDELYGKLHARRQDVQVALEPTPMGVRGLAGVTLETAGGESLSLDRGDGGLRAVRRDTRSRPPTEHSWTILGASRGESGILGEGIRQALLRDPTYGPALSTANALLHA
jgi:glucose-6-phosphate dehydrogenase assembly protein OpcA